VIVTVFGLGAWLGAVYVALSAIALLPVLCVVTVLSVPQDAPLHPVPESDQFSTELGLDPGTGVNVATIVAEPPAGKFAGAVNCKVKLLVRLTLTEACFEESATLVAVTVTLEAAGRIPGAA
jgi:hypothetical protein